MEIVSVDLAERVSTEMRRQGTGSDIVGVRFYNILVANFGPRGAQGKKRKIYRSVVSRATVRSMTSLSTEPVEDYDEDFAAVPSLLAAPARPPPSHILHSKRALG